MKAANEAGITDPDEIGRLLVLAKRAQLSTAHPEQFEEGFAKAAAEAGLDKEALVWPWLVGAGALGLGGLIGGLRGRKAGMPWNLVDKADAQRGYDAYQQKGMLGKGWANLTNPALMQAVRAHRERRDDAYERRRPGGRPGYNPRSWRQYGDYYRR